MKYAVGRSRSQIALFPISLEAAVDECSEVRLIDTLVDSLDLEQLGFKVSYGENDSKAMGKMLTKRE